MTGIGAGMSRRCLQDSSMIMNKENLTKRGEIKTFIKLYLAEKKLKIK